MPKSPVYDENDTQPVYKPDLLKQQGIQGGSSSSSSANNKGGSGNYQMPGVLPGKSLNKSEKENGKQGNSPGEDSSSRAEKLAMGIAATSGGQKAFRGLRNFTKNIQMTKKQKSTALIAGGASGGIVGLIVTIFILLIPLKIEHIVNNLEDRFFAGPEMAVEDESENLMSGYFKDLMEHFPSSKTCSSSAVDKDCLQFFSGHGPISNLYHTWAQAGVGEKLATEAGIEVKYNPTDHNYYMTSPGDTDPEHDSYIDASEVHSDDDLFDSPAFHSSSRAEIRQAVRDYTKNETLMNRVLLHFKFGTYLEEKFGIKRCIAFCTIHDQLADAVDHGKNAAKIYLVRRVIAPRAQSLAIVLECLFDSNCTPSKEQDPPLKTCADDCEINAAPESATETQLRTTLTQLAESFGIEDSSSLITLYNDIEEAGGVQSYFIQQALTLALAGDAEAAAAVTQSIDKALPVIGWINLAAQVIKEVSSAGPKIKKLDYIIGAASAVSLYMMYRSYSDEVKTGQANPVEVGQFANELGPTGATNDPNDPNLGGTASAEAAPLYSTLIDGNQPLSTTSSSMLNEIWGGTAYAQSTTPAPIASSTFTCKDGKSPAQQTPSSEICPEEMLGVGNSILNSISGFFAIPGLSQIKAIADAWENTVGKLFNLATDLLAFIGSPLIKIADQACDVPILGDLGPFGPYCILKAEAAGIGGPLMKGIMEFIVPNPFGTNMSGARTFDELAAGADVSSNEFAHNGLGGQALTNAQVADLVNQSQSEDQYAFDHESFFARIFDSSSNYSLITKLADLIPFNFNSVVQSALTSFISNPLNGARNGIASFIAGGGVASAAAPLGNPSSTDDIFGVTQYGYTANDPIFTQTDPETYWDKNCTDNPNDADPSQIALPETYNWNTAAANASNSIPTANAFLDPINGQAVNTTTDPCLLIQAAIGASGGIFNSSLLQPDDLSDTTGNATNANAGIFLIGDSLLSGMNTAGLQATLTSAGWNVTGSIVGAGATVESTQPQLAADAAAISGAGTIYIELGSSTADQAEGAGFSSTIDNFVQAIKAINPNAQIYWQDTYATAAPGSTEYQLINTAIEQEATPDGYKVIDWQTEATNNASLYNFIAGDSGADLDAPSYVNMANWLSGQLTSPGYQVASGNTDIVAQTLNPPGTPSNSVFANFLSNIKTVESTLDRPFKDIGHILGGPTKELGHSLARPTKELDMLWITRQIK